MVNRRFSKQSQPTVAIIIDRQTQKCMQQKSWPEFFLERLVSIFIPSMHKCTKLPLLCIFFFTRILCAVSACHTLHFPLNNPPTFDSSNNIWSRMQAVKLLTKQRSRCREWAGAGGSGV